ncbi:MAG: hypothetical protein AAGF96_11305 [Bacteroidota bacterium]
MKKNKELLDNWKKKALNQELPYGQSFYKGFQVATSVSSGIESIDEPSETITCKGAYSIIANYLPVRFRNHKIRLKIQHCNKKVIWEDKKYTDLTFNTIVPKEGLIIVEPFKVIGNGTEKIDCRLFKNNHYSISQFFTKKCLEIHRNERESRKVQIFLASSQELKDDRKDFEIFISRMNQAYFDKGIFFDLIIWENFIDRMTQKGLQNEYNKAVAESDIFVMLFFKKVGPYTSTEFDTAHKSFQDTNKPIIYTFFKDAPIMSGELSKEESNSLFDFQAKLKRLKHYSTKYRNSEDLYQRIESQIEKLFKSGEI